MDTYLLLIVWLNKLDIGGKYHLEYASTILCKIRTLNHMSGSYPGLLKLSVYLLISLHLGCSRCHGICDLLVRTSSTSAVPICTAVSGRKSRHAWSHTGTTTQLIDKIDQLQVPGA